MQFTPGRDVSSQQTEEGPSILIGIWKTLQVAKDIIQSWSWSNFLKVLFALPIITINIVIIKHQLKKKKKLFMMCVSVCSTRIMLEINFQMLHIHA